VIGQLDTGVGYTDVEPAELFDGGREQVLDVGNLRDIRPDRDRLASGAFNGSDSVEGRLLVVREEVFRLTRLSWRQL